MYHEMIMEMISMHKTPIALIKSGGFKYGGSPRANYYFDVGFIKNPARVDGKWNFYSEIDDEMREYVLGQKCVKNFISKVVPLIELLVTVDQFQVFAFCCNSGRHRSPIVAKEVCRRLLDKGIVVKYEKSDSF